ncbi:5'-methylthioadenosine/S-adenosylhomocysteine nucleosidase family protein [Nisaea nitritireducens]|uniref:5'-methylthioadenosine/S-adenosylhomocysteine nucleosidase family protein n=1 Tax=Nisaea nitritireducens TaxID=568392 RepID=UPI001867B332|nr:hypothetical protein [Nisaea nitritireducens]
MAKNHSSDSPVIANVVLVVALPEEREYFHEVVESRPLWKATTARKRYRCTYNSPVGDVSVVVQTLDGMGHIEAVVGTGAAIATATPELVVMIGIAGSLNPVSIGLGDVVVSNTAKFYASDKVSQIYPEESAGYVFGTKDDLKNAKKGEVVVDRRDRFLKSSFLRYERKVVHSAPMDGLLSGAEEYLKACDLEQIEVNALPDRFARLDSSSREREVHFGSLLGSHHVVDSAEYRDYLVEKNTNTQLDIHRQNGDSGRVQWDNSQILAVDMESYGVLRAVETARTTPDREGGCTNLFGGVIVRGISDICEYKGDLDRDTGNAIRRVAAANATEVALSFIEAIDYVEFGSA